MILGDEEEVLFALVNSQASIETNVHFIPYSPTGFNMLRETVKCIMCYGNPKMNWIEKGKGL